MQRTPVRARAGWVYLVGAGPGDAGLLTLKGRELLGTCDCVLHDRLVGEEVLAYAPARAERIDVGKVGHGPQFAQDETQALLIDRARRGRAVVRLKGGCPTVFGRAAEEAGALRTAGIPFEIVPGVSSALAVPAYAGIPLTHRRLASSLAIVTGHCAAERKRAVAGVAHADTVVVLMGASALGAVVAELLAAGRAPETPAAFVSRGTQEGQRTILGTLGTLAAEVARAGGEGPAVIVVGEVVGLAGGLGWFRPESDRVVGDESQSDISVAR